MAQTIQQILASRNLIGRIVDVVNGVPEDILPPGYTKGTRTTEGDRGEYLRVEGTRQTSRSVRYGSPAKETAPVGLKSTPVKLLHTFESFTHDPTILQLLMSESGDGSMMRQQLGRETIQRQLDVFGTRFRNLRMSCVYSALALGAIYFDGEGNLLPTSSGAKHTIDFSVPAGNKAQLDWDGNGAIIGASWGTAGTDILADIKAVKKAARTLTGIPITTAFYGENIPGYMANNNAIKNMIIGSPRLSEQFAANELPDIGNLKWIPVEQAFFVDQAGATQRWFGADTVVFAPDPTPEWWEVIEGTYPVPRSIQLAADMAAALGNFQQVSGPFSFANIGVNPPSLQHFAGDTFLTVLKNPNAIFIADVTP